MSIALSLVFAFTPAQNAAATQLGQLPLASTPAVRPCAPTFKPLPQWRATHSMSSSAGCGASAWPYDVQYSPDGARLYVSLFGGLVGSGGCRVLRLDPTSFATLAEIPTGESPQDLAFTVDANGAVVRGFVANSSGSSVTIFSAQDAVLATVAIPFAPGSFFPTAFPASLAVAPSQSHVYVSTQDGSGRVLALDANTLALDPARAIQLGPEHSSMRMVFAGQRLVICASQALPNWVGSTAKVMVVDPAQPQLVRGLALATANNGFAFPSVQDCAVDCDGLVWVCGYDMGARVFAIDPRGPTLVRVVDTHTSQPDGKFQSLALSRDGVLCVADMWTNELAVLDTRLRRWRATLDLTSLPSVQQAAQELEFTPDGRVLLTTFAATDNLSVFDL